MAEMLNPEQDPIQSETHEAVAAAREAIVAQQADGPSCVANATSTLGLFAELSAIQDKYKAENRSIQWTKLKAGVAAGLSVAPLMGTLTNIRTAQRVGGEYTALRKTAQNSAAVRQSELQSLNASSVMKDAKAAQAEAAKHAWDAELGKKKKEALDSLKAVTVPMNRVQEAKRAAVNTFHEAGDLRNARRALAEVAKNPAIGPEVRAAAEGAVNLAKADLKSSGKRLGLSVLSQVATMTDPFPDVPDAVRTIAGFAEWVLPGANIVPAVWQLAVTEVADLKTQGKMMGEMGAAVKNRLDGKFAQAKNPAVEAAAGAFRPTPST